MRIEEFTQQGFKKCPPELIPSLRTPMNEDSNFFIKELYKMKDNVRSYIVLEDNGSKFKLKLIHVTESAGWGEHIMNLNTE